MCKYIHSMAGRNGLEICSAIPVEIGFYIHVQVFDEWQSDQVWVKLTGA